MYFFCGSKDAGVIGLEEAERMKFVVVVKSRGEVDETGAKTEDRELGLLIRAMIPACCLNLVAVSRQLIRRHLRGHVPAVGAF